MDGRLHVADGDVLPDGVVVVLPAGQGDRLSESGGPARALNVSASPWPPAPLADLPAHHD
jgi:hypothetical protein